MDRHLGLHRPVDPVDRRQVLPCAGLPALLAVVAAADRRTVFRQRGQRGQIVDHDRPGGAPADRVRQVHDGAGAGAVHEFLHVRHTPVRGSAPRRGHPRTAGRDRHAAKRHRIGPRVRLVPVHAFPGGIQRLGLRRAVPSHLAVRAVVPARAHDAADRADSGLCRGRSGDQRTVAQQGDLFGGTRPRSDPDLCRSFAGGSSDRLVRGHPVGRRAVLRGRRRLRLPIQDTQYADFRTAVFRFARLYPHDRLRVP